MCQAGSLVSTQIRGLRNLAPWSKSSFEKYREKRNFHFQWGRLAASVSMTKRFVDSRSSGSWGSNTCR